jgi:chromosome partitioning protein
MCRFLPKWILEFPVILMDQFPEWMQGADMRTIAIINQKGGCGKTTVSINLASALAVKGHRTLLVDMDPQSHCAVGLAVPEDQIEQSIYDILVSHSRAEPIRLTEIMWKISENFELTPASIDLAAFEQQMAGMVDSELCLKKVLETVKRNYDYVIIDCPPSLNMLTLNGLVAANGVIIPMQCEYFALEGLSALVNTVGRVSATVNKSLKIEGIVRTMYDPRNSLTRDVTSQLTTHFGDQLYRTVIPRNVRLAEAPSYGLPALHYDKQSKGAIAYLALAGEVLRRSSAAASAVTATVDSAPVRADKSSAAVTTAAAGEYDAS